MKKAMPIICLAMLLIGMVHASDTSYLVTVKENGEALVIVTINGTGLFRLPLQKDVDDIKVKGALYNIENRTAEISIGSVGKAIVLYKTSMLTSKSGEKWVLDMELIRTNYSKVVLNFPVDVLIDSSVPKAFVEQSQYKKVMMEGKFSNIHLEYSFKNQDMPELANLTATNSSEIQKSQGLVVRDNLSAGKSDATNSLVNPFTVGFGVVVLAGVSTVLVLRKKNDEANRDVTLTSTNKQNIINTLPRNEEMIVNLLVENQGSMKRSLLEKKSRIAKSSLASSLHNLEKKNIVQVDRTFTTHFVKFTKWFEEL